MALRRLQRHAGRLVGEGDAHTPPGHLWLGRADSRLCVAQHLRRRPRDRLLARLRRRSRRGGGRRARCRRCRVAAAARALQLDGARRHGRRLREGRLRRRLLLLLLLLRGLRLRRRRRRRRRRAAVVGFLGGAADGLADGALGEVVARVGRLVGLDVGRRALAEHRREVAHAVELGHLGQVGRRLHAADADLVDGDLPRMVPDVVDVVHHHGLAPRAVRLRLLEGRVEGGAVGDCEEALNGARVDGGAVADEGLVDGDLVGRLVLNERRAAGRRERHDGGAEEVVAADGVIVKDGDDHGELLQVVRAHNRP
mmetsp:Transcript_56984/g.156524  ORF Transcript_56984/g.156524 Transcript_56984/m.156524 type:complete len:311 (-) Transcript_56984:2151-3083(-)